MFHIQINKINFKAVSYSVKEGNKIIAKFEIEEDASEWIYANSDQRLIDILED